MGVTKSNLFTENQNNIAKSAKLFAHPARVAILQYLAKSNQCINSDLVEELGLAQATISQHLRELKDQGLIKGNIEGTSVCYCINGERWNEIKNEFNLLFDNITKSCC
jgi:DNA-binding transcriptional ArsR family regulator